MEENKNRFWNLLEPEHLRARAFCRKLMGNRDDGDDLYQDALVDALTGLPALCDTNSFRPWLYRIMVNTFKNRVRRKGLIRQTSLTAAIESGAKGDNPDPRYAARRRLERAFRVLSADDRALVTLFELEGWSIADLAVMFGKRKGNIKVRLSRARKKMRRALINSPSSQKKRKTVPMLSRKDDVCVAAKPGKN